MTSNVTPITQAARNGSQSHLLTPGEVARMFNVTPKTVSKWAKAGKLTSLRTIGGHRRFVRTEVEAHLTNWQRS